MAAQEHAQVPERTTTQDEEAVPIVVPPPSELKERMDAVLDDIDSVLEENAELFVKSYVQKGGQ